MSLLQPYIYKPIPTLQAKSTIRLFTLLPGEGGTPIRGVLKLFPGILLHTNGTADGEQPHHYRDEEHQKFEALSYVWGDPLIKVSIIIDGYELLIPSNLELFLQRLRAVDYPRVLWADSICVDQANLDERSSQVMLMAQIYQKASTVPIWLGEEDEHTTLAFEAVERLNIGGLMGSEQGRSQLVAIRPAISNDWLTAPPFRWSDLSLEQVKAMERTFRDKTWWKRLWTVQECVLATEPLLMCGMHTSSWSAIQNIMTPELVSYEDAAERDTLKSRAIAALIPWGELNRLRVTCRQGDGAFIPPQGLCVAMNWISRVGFREFTDPRDVVYGILSLVQSEGSTIVPDYNKSVSAVYTETTRALIRETQGLNSICLRNLARPSQIWVPTWSLETDQPPTWVPDYSFPRHCPIVVDPVWVGEREPYNATGQVPFDANLALSESDNILRVQCIRWDTVLHSCQVRGGRQNYKTAMCLYSMQLYKLLGHLEALNEGRYPAGEDMASVFYRTIRRDVRSHTPPPIQRLDESTIDTNKAGFHLWYNLRSAFDESHYGMSMDDMEIIGGDMIVLCSEPTSNDNLSFRCSLLDILCCDDRTMYDDRTFFVTAKGYLGMAEGFVEIGDEVCIAYGAPAPLIVRPAGDEFEGKRASIPEAGFHTFVRAAYVHGIMDGEVVEGFGGEEMDTVFLV